MRVIRVILPIANTGSPLNNEQGVSSAQQPQVVYVRPGARQNIPVPQTNLPQERESVRNLYFNFPHNPNLTVHLDIPRVRQPLTPPGGSVVGLSLTYNF